MKVETYEVEDSGYLVVNEDNEWLATGLTKEQAIEKCNDDVKENGGSCFAFEVIKQIEVRGK